MVEDYFENMIKKRKKILDPDSIDKDEETDNIIDNIDRLEKGGDFPIHEKFTREKAIKKIRDKDKKG